MTAWRAPLARRASATAITGRSSALLGTHAQYEHSPPTSSRSTTATLRPAARTIGDILADRTGPDDDDVVDVLVHIHGMPLPVSESVSVKCPRQMRPRSDWRRLTWADAYNDVHCSSSPVRKDRTPAWGLQLAD